MRITSSCIALLSLYAQRIVALSDVILVKESVEVPEGWVKVGRANVGHTLNLRIGLPQPNFGLLEQHLYEISDPHHERYGNHLSKEEVEALVSPHQTSLDSVDQWLASHGLREIQFTRSPAKDWVSVKVPVAVAETMLNTTFYLWKHLESGDLVVRTTMYSLPRDVHDHIDVIQPTTIFARWKAMATTLHRPGHGDFFKEKSKSKLGAVDVDLSCTEAITVKCLAQLYKTAGYVPKATNKNGLGITGYLEQFANFADLRSFYESQVPEAVNSSFTFFSVNGGLNNQTLDEAGEEAGLDIQFAFGLSYPTPGTFWSTGGRPPFIPDNTAPTNDNEPYADWLDFVLKQGKIPQTISTSYADHEQTVPEAYARRVCRGFAQLGARGVSVLFASGDGGVSDGNSDPKTQQCFSNDGKNTYKFLPMFPPSCPYVTSVGGTFGIPEVAVPFSGGGFSYYFAQPPYQKSAVASYLSKLPPGHYDGLYNREGRGFPDVSAQSYPFQTWWKGEALLLGGTSASSPVVAAVVALLNDARLAKNLPPLGFLNPLLYSKGVNGFNDITEGNNVGCGTLGFNVRLSCLGLQSLTFPYFKATAGWDPVTGLGTPDFLKLKKLFT
ncbi:hypothetical protein M413DRAFT_315351 [Hebeloma cylindrosporum]|uniref:tripeptidyl-peptidase II n=1 Tax=Hebeloma cylindrosporum TaxID=76867 RepID=A0A0C3CRC5_HEBCY|nr:hypothetical protein M413DRAFT_315351 [Hebeloma cylindrosporum h7]